MRDVAPDPEPVRRAPGSRRDRSSPDPEEQLEGVVDRLRQLADELPHAMAWVEVEVEALRSDVREALKAIAARNATERDELARQVALVQRTVSGLEEEVRALRVALRPRRGPDEAGGGEPAAQGPRDRDPDPAPQRMGLGLPPRRPRI